FRPGEQHDFGAASAQSLSALGAVGQEGQQSFLGQAVGERTEPDLKPDVRCVRGRDLEAVGGASRDADGRAVEVVANDLHVAADHIRLERFVGAGAGVEETRVVVDALGSHGSFTVLHVPYLSSSGLEMSICRYFLRYY